MSVKIIVGYNDEEWESISAVFYNNFNPDDWDYIIIGKSEKEVDDISYKFMDTYREVEEINGLFWAVTYH